MLRTTIYGHWDLVGFAGPVDLVFLEGDQDSRFPFAARLVAPDTNEYLFGCGMCATESVFLADYLARIFGDRPTRLPAYMGMSCQLYGSDGDRPDVTLNFGLSSDARAIDVSVVDAAFTLAQAQIFPRDIEGFVRRLGAHYGA